MNETSDYERVTKSFMQHICLKTLIHYKKVTMSESLNHLLN